VLIPNVVRILFVLTLPVAARAGKIPDLEDHSVVLIGVYFFVPDLIRYLLVNLTFLPRFFSLPSMEDFIRGLRSIWHNWLFDFGSAITESGDKILVGALIGPQLLVAYFFARKIGAAVTIVIEPFYAEHYRRIVVGQAEQRTRRQIATYLQGVLLGASVCLVGISVVLVASRIPFVSSYVPEAVQTNLVLFCAILLIDSGVAANRWSRYISQSGNRSLVLLTFRIALIFTFALSLMLLKHLSGGLALSLSFFLLWLLEGLFLIVMLRTKGSFVN
jgi:O-antigen/teichoic acid export membrane protein